MYKVPSSFKRLLLVPALCAALLALWNWGLLYNLAKPTVLRASPRAAAPVRAADYSGHAPAIIYPKIGVEAPLTESAESSPLRTQDWEKLRQALYKGVDLSFDGPSFDQAPLAFVVGHSSDISPHLYSSIFAGLGQSSIGDTFLVITADGKYAYRVVEKKVLDPYDLAGFSAASLGAVPSGPQRLALVTCWPVLTTRNRLVVVGERLAN